MINYVYHERTEGDASWEEKAAMKTECTNSSWKSWGVLIPLEKEHKKETGELKTEIADLKKENLLLRQENQLLKDDNARLKSIINNDSSNTSLPPSADQKGKPANTYNGRKKRNVKQVDRKAIKGQHFQKLK